MAFDWKKMLTTVAPFIGAAATGNVPALVGMAATAIGSALGKDVKPTADGIEAAMAGATPDDLLKIRQAENDFAEKMQALGFDHTEKLEQIAAADRDSARQREIKTGDSWTPRLIAAVFIVGYFSVQWFLLQHIVPPEMREIIMRTLGTLDMGLGLILGYYFGSSASSAAKNDIIAAQARGNDGSK